MLISKIRKYSWLAVGAIAVCLIGFLVQDATRSDFGIFAKNKAPEYAAIDGEEVTQAEFSERRQQSMIEYLTFNNLIMAAQQGQYQMDARTEFGVGEQAWNDFVNERLVSEQLDKLGLTITEDEFSTLIYGNDPHPVIKNYYIGLSKTGQYDASLLPRFVDQISDPEAQKNNPQLMQEYYQFVSREKVAKRDYLQNKYMSLFTQSSYVPEWLAKKNYTAGNNRAAFTFVTIPYTTIADSTITVSDSELKNYYNANKNKYKQTEGRVIEYVSWDFTATRDDSLNVLNSLMETVAKMKAAKNDSTFIASRSDDEDHNGTGYYTRQDLYAKTIDSAVVDSFFMKPVGSLVGPYMQNGYYKMAKLKSRNNMPDSVNARHILISVSEKRDSVTAKNLIDSLKSVLAAGGDFAQLAKEYSEDSGSKDNGGDLGWSTPAVNFVPEFKEFLFKTGTVGKAEIVKTDFGYHIIEIKEIKNRKDFVNIAVMSKQIGPGKATIDSIEKAANDFYAKYQTPETFEQGVIDNRLFKRVSQPLQKNLFEVPGLENTRDIITWAFDAKKDEFKYFSENDRVVIAFVKEIKVDGIADLDNVRDQVEQEVIKEKKAEMLKKKFEEAMKGASSLDAIAAKVGGRVDSVTNASMGTPYAPIIGLEPKVIGAAFGTESGKMSKPIDGNRGVYVIMAGVFTPAPEVKDYTMNKNQLTYTLQNKFQGQGMLLELKEKAGVVDNRYRFGD